MGGGIVTEFKFGDVVRYGNSVLSDPKTMMVIAVRDDCPHHTPPCFVLSRLDEYDDPEELSGWCYTLSDDWKVV